MRSVTGVSGIVFAIEFESFEIVESDPLDGSNRFEKMMIQDRISVLGYRLNSRLSL